MLGNVTRLMPVLRGTIARRLLINYRVDPAVAARLLPAPFRPHCYDGHAIAGVCLIRLARVRPKWLPGRFGLALDNAAVRIAAEWDTPAGTRSGVFVLARYTASRIAALAGGRIFPGVHRRARIASRESLRRVAVSMLADDGFGVRVTGEATTDWPTDSIFASPAAASSFFAAGSLGYSWHAGRREFECLELCVPHWNATPFAVDDLAASYFDDPSRFPSGSVALDHALAMRGIEHEWRLRDPIAVGAGRAVHSPHSQSAPTTIRV